MCQLQPKTKTVIVDDLDFEQKQTRKRACSQTKMSSVSNKKRNIVKRRNKKRICDNVSVPEKQRKASTNTLPRSTTNTVSGKRKKTITNVVSGKRKKTTTNVVLGKRKKATTNLVSRKQNESTSLSLANPERKVPYTNDNSSWAEECVLAQGEALSDECVKTDALMAVVTQLLSLMQI